MGRRLTSRSYGAQVMYTMTEEFPLSLDANLHPFGVPVVMTVPAELTGWTASVLPFAPVSVGPMPQPRALSVALVH
jgi:hypothetical protein